MRIAITGTHSTGKTTLVNRLACRKEFKEFVESYSNTRRLGKLGLPINCERGEVEDPVKEFDDTQELVLTHHLKDLLNPKLIADRCLIDGLAYTQYLNTRGQVSNHTLELFGQLTSNFAHSYDIIFYSPIVGRAEADGVRDVDESFRIGVDKIIQKLLPGIPTHVFTLPGSDLDANIEFVLEAIKAVLTIGKENREEAIKKAKVVPLNSNK